MRTLILAILSAYLVAQVCKMVILAIRTGGMDWKIWFLPGGMPSVHSTLVTSVVMSLWLDQGLTPLVIASGAFAGIVMYDAMTLRREVSLHKQVISKLHLKVENRAMKTLLKAQNIGHTPAEVSAGIALGIVVPWLVYIPW